LEKPNFRNFDLDILNGLIRGLHWDDDYGEESVHWIGFSLRNEELSVDADDQLGEMLRLCDLMNKEPPPHIAAAHEPSWFHQMSVRNESDAPEKESKEHKKG
jgi:hypothetical protein